MIHLPVPYYSQRDNTYVWRYRYEEDIKNEKGEIFYKGEYVRDTKGSEIQCNIADGCCNITCLAMVLNYLGVTKDTPLQMSKKIFAEKYSKDDSDYESDFDRYISYRVKAGVKAEVGNECIESPEIISLIAKDIYKVRNVYVGYHYTLEDVKKEVKAGYPVIVSCGIIRPSLEYLKKNYGTDDENRKNAERNQSWEYRGHYIVICGFIRDEYILINDPWGKATNDENRLPQELINNMPNDGWGNYKNNINKGIYKGESIVITEEDFRRQYKNTFNSVVIVYERRWSFPFDSILNNFIKIRDGLNQHFIPNPIEVERCNMLESNTSHFPLSTLSIPHNGIDYMVNRGTKIYSMGSGMVVAAKLCLGQNEELSNGSNCFVLIKHSVQIAEERLIKTFFILYNHLSPVKIDEREIQISFVKELVYEKDRNISVLKNEADIKLQKLKKGEIVIFNDGDMLSEVAEYDLIGYTGAKGILPYDEKNKIHIEIFSNENIFKDKKIFPEYCQVDISSIDIYDRSQVIEKYKETLFGDFINDVNYKKFTKHITHNALGRPGIEEFYKSEYKKKASKIVVKSKSLWSADRNVAEERSLCKGFTFIKDDNYGDRYEKPYLWWTKEVDDAINNNLVPKIVNKIVFFYHPIDFLCYLMGNDDSLYKSVCPKSYKDELEKQGEEFLAASALQRIAALGSMDAGEQMALFKDIVHDSRLTDRERGTLAASLRQQRDKFELKELFEQDGDFMNEELRDFLNLNENGTMEYSMDEIMSEIERGDSQWKKMSLIGSLYHQYTAPFGEWNVKFVHADGREN